MGLDGEFVGAELGRLRTGLMRTTDRAELDRLWQGTFLLTRGHNLYVKQGEPSVRLREDCAAWMTEQGFEYMLLDVPCEKRFPFSEPDVRCHRFWAFALIAHPSALVAFKLRWG